MFSIIIVGIGGWEQYTRPLIADIWGYDPCADIIVVDNASDAPYPTAPHICRTDKRLDYAEAINFGIEQAGESDLYIVMNNDARVKTPDLLKFLMDYLKGKHGSE